MRKDGRGHSADEPARQQEYQRLYRRTKAHFDQFNDVIDHLVKRIARLEQRVRELELR